MNSEPIVHPACQSVYDASGNVVFAGEWDPSAIFDVLSKDKSIWKGQRVLDIGANSLGLSVEIARAGGIVTAAEPDPYNNTYARSRETVEGLVRRESLKLDYQRKAMFDLAGIGEFDIVLCLGLVYHFRDPQFCLDHLSTIPHQKLFISTQTAAGDDLVLWNRRDASVLRPGHLRADIVLSGWHPTRPIFERMLLWAGFDDIRSLTDMEYNFPVRQKGLTNSAYFSARRVRETDPIKSRHQFYPR